MNSEYSRAVLELAVNIGETLLENGGEISRVQETMERVAKSYGCDQFHAYVLTNGIFASMDGREDGDGAVRHVPTTRVHLGRVAGVNELSRDIASGNVPPEEAAARLAAIRKLPYTSPAASVAACAVGAGCFAVLFGGSVPEFAVAFFAGGVMQICAQKFLTGSMGKIITNILLAAIVVLFGALGTAAAAALGVAVNLDQAIIGGIIPLVPGMVLTTSFRDFANGDYLSGTIRIMDALLVAGSIAVGVGAVLAVRAALTGGVL